MVGPVLFDLLDFGYGLGKGIYFCPFTHWKTVNVAIWPLYFRFTCYIISCSNSFLQLWICEIYLNAAVAGFLLPGWNVVHMKLDIIMIIMITMPFDFLDFQTFMSWHFRHCAHPWSSMWLWSWPILVPLPYCSRLAVLVWQPVMGLSWWSPVFRHLLLKASASVNVLKR